MCVWYNSEYLLNYFFAIQYVGTNIFFTSLTSATDFDGKKDTNVAPKYNLS